MSPATARTTRWILLLLAALLLRLGAGAWWESRVPAGQQFGFPDSNSYWFLAGTIARGEPYQYGSHDLRVFRTPGYPLMIAGLMAVVGVERLPVLAVRGVGAILGTLTVALVGCLGWYLFDEPTGWTAAALVTIYPGAIAMSVFVLSEGPFCAFMVAQLGCWAVAWRQDGRKRWLAAIAAGVLGGWATLIRPSWLLFTPLAIGIGLVFGPRRGRQLALGACLLGGIGLTMAPWWFRNYSVTGSFVPTTLQMGASLYDGLSPAADGSSDMRFVAKFRARQRRLDEESTTPPRGTFEQRLDNRMRDAAVAWAVANPTSAVRLAGVKFLRMWNFWPNATELQSWTFRLAVLIGYTPLVVLCLIGTWWHIGRGWPYWLCLLPGGYFTCLHMVFVSSIRYRQPAMLPWAVLAAAAVVSIWRGWRERAVATEPTNAARDANTGEQDDNGSEGGAPAAP